jgi:F-type H+-transporting ATPase subunit b
LKIYSPNMSFPIRFSRFALPGIVLVAALAAGLASLPSFAAAQDSAPAAAAAQAPVANAGSSQNAPVEKAADPEEEQINGFLHAPAVKALARFLHLDLKTTDNLFLGIDFAIIFLAIGIPLARVMPKILRKRQTTLQHNLVEARKLTESANARLKAVEQKLSRLGEDIQKFRDEVETELKNEEARIKSAIEEETARIVASAEQEIGLAAVQARRSLRKFAADLAVEQAAKQIALTPDTDRALIAEFAASVSQDHGGIGTGKSGAGGKN